MRASRLLSMLMILQINGRLTATELSERLEVSTRTIYRDLDALSMAGVPIYTERGPHGGCGLIERYRTTLTGMTHDEVRSLFAMMIPSVLDDLGGEAASESAQLKLMASLPANLQKDAQRIRETVYLDPAGWFQPPEPTPFLTLVQDALWQGRKLRITYRRGDGNWVKRLLEPYGLVGKGGTWYLVAATYGGPMSWRVSRIREAELTESIFQRPDDFDLESYWSTQTKSFEESQLTYTVRLDVAPQGATALVRLFGEGIYFLLEQAPLSLNGRTVIELPFASEEDACMRLLGLPETVDVVAPESLRERLRKTALTVATRYAA